MKKDKVVLDPDLDLLSRKVYLRVTVVGSPDPHTTSILGSFRTRQVGSSREK